MLYITVLYKSLSHSAAVLTLREVMFKVTEGDPGFDTYVLIIADVMGGQQDIVVSYTVSSTATSMYKFAPFIRYV